MIREKIGEQIGSAIILPMDKVKAGTVHTWKIVYTVGKKGIVEGGGIKVMFPRGFSQPRILPSSHFIVHDNVNYCQPGFVSAVSTNNRIKLELNCESPYKVTGGYREWWPRIYITVKNSFLKKGEKIILTYGDTRTGSPGAITSQIAQKARFLIGVDPDGRGKAPYTGYYLIKKIPQITVIPREAVKLIVTVPSTVKVGEKFDVTVAARDKYGNVANGYKWPIILSTTDKASILSLTYNFTGKDKGVHTFRNAAVFKSRGIRYIKVMDKNNKLYGVSNPIDCGFTIASQRLYWGDPHCHTELSDGLGTVREVYTYARDVTRLNFAAVVDHDVGERFNVYLNDEEWEETKRETSKFWKEKRFITFLAYEYSQAPHKVIYYYHLNEPIFRSANLSQLGKVSQNIWQRRVRRLWKELEGKKVMIADHGHAGFCWELYHPRLHRLTEVYAHHGCAEKEGSLRPGRGAHPGNYLQDGLAKGYRLGIIASSDGHDGHPGYSLWSATGEIQYRGGLTAVYAPVLTKKALWDSLWNRYCYATTGERIILSFKINSHMMGEDIKLGSKELKEERKIQVKVAGTAKIQRINIVRNNVDIYTHQGKGVVEEFEWTDKEILSLGKAQLPTIYYYIRVIQENGEMAWSSSVYFFERNKTHERRY